MPTKKYQFMTGLGLLCAIVVVAIMCTISITTPSHIDTSTVSEKKSNAALLGNGIPINVLKWHADNCFVFSNIKMSSQLSTVA